MRSFLGTVLLATALAACASSIEPEVVFIQVPTQPPSPPGVQAGMAALLSGTLVADARWGVAVASPDGAIVKVVWPHGYFARLAGPRRDRRRVVCLWLAVAALPSISR